MADQVAIPLLPNAGVATNPGPSGLDLASTCKSSKERKMKQALHNLRPALASAGFDPR